MSENARLITITSTSDWLEVTIKEGPIKGGAWTISKPLFVSSTLSMEQTDISTQTVHWKGVSKSKDNSLTIRLYLSTTADTIWFTIRKGGLGEVKVASEADSCIHKEFTSDPRHFNIALTKPAAERLRATEAETA